MTRYAKYVSNSHLISIDTMTIFNRYHKMFNNKLTNKLVTFFYLKLRGYNVLTLNTVRDNNGFYK